MIRLEFQEALNDFIDEENDIKISKIVLSLKNAFVDQNGAVQDISWDVANFKNILLHNNMAYEIH